MTLQNKLVDPAVVPLSTWERNTLSFTDRITVQNLQANVQAGTDAWERRERTQPALISFTVFLAQPFDSAAKADKLDNSTIHYGVLSKNILSGLKDAQHVWRSSHSLGTLIEETAIRVAGPVSIGSLSVDIFYPKGSLLGDGAGFSSHVSYAESSVSRVLYLKNLRIPCLIGVNSNERKAKQPVVVNVLIENLGENRSDDYPSLERVVVETISSSSFETLESLVTDVVADLRTKFIQPESDREASIRLRVEKPLAVPFADAPAIEIIRPAVV